MIFKKVYRQIEFKEDFTFEVICDLMNRKPNSNLLSTLNKDGVTVTKKYFSDFFPLNFDHLGSLTIHAKSIKTESNAESLKFIIEMNDFVKFSTYGGVAILIALGLFSIFFEQFIFGMIILLFTSFALFWSKVIHNWGISNFTKNWDEQFGTKV